MAQSNCAATRVDATCIEVKMLDESDRRHAKRLVYFPARDRTRRNVRLCKQRFNGVDWRKLKYHKVAFKL